MKMATEPNEMCAKSAINLQYLIVGNSPLGAGDLQLRGEWYLTFPRNFLPPRLQTLVCQAFIYYKYL